MISPTAVNLIPLSRCENTLNVPGTALWRSPLPPLAVGGLLVTGTPESMEGFAVDLDRDLLDVLFALYPMLSWIQVVTITRHKAFSNEARSRFVNLYGYRWNEDLERISEIPFSSVAQQWLAEKSLGPREIAPLLILNNGNLQNQVVEKITNSKATRSHGARLIELISEILATPSNASLLLENELHFFPQPELWIQKLEAIRFPGTVKRDAEMAQRLKNLDLPLKVKAEFRRSGDETGVELKISARAPAEMHKILSDLNSKSWEVAWKSNSPGK